jgi:hypothetical protein
MVLFSSDFPHVEGGRNPLKRFNDSLAGVDAAADREVLPRQLHRPDGRGPGPVPARPAVACGRLTVSELKWRDPPLAAIDTPKGSCG